MDFLRPTLLAQLSATPLIILLIMGGCGDPLKGSEEDLSPLATLQVQLTAPEALAGELELPPDGSLRLGVIWVKPHNPDAWCSLALTSALGLPSAPQRPPSASGEGETEEELAGEPRPPLTPELTALALERCRDPLGVAPSLAGPSVAVSSRQVREGALVELPFMHLPSAEVLFGTPDSRVGYATVVLFEDTNRDEALTFGEAGRVGRRRGGPDEGKGAEEPDHLYGASWLSLAEPHARLVYQEGRSTEGFFYPTVGCPERPQGLSVLESSAALSDLLSLFSPEAPPPSENTSEERELCVIDPLSEPLSLTPQPPSPRLQELVCEPLEDEGEEPPEREPDEGLEMTCLSATELVAVDPEAVCKGVALWRLVGCPLNEVSCEAPEWDMRTNVPTWWPCDQEGAEGESAEEEVSGE